MINAWIIAKETGVIMSWLNFMENVIISLIGKHTADDPAPAAKSVRVKKDEPPVSRTVGQHWAVLGMKGRCVECYSSSHDTKKSRILCKQCGMHLHTDCFKQWHKKRSVTILTTKLTMQIGCMGNEITWLIDHKLAS